VISLADRLRARTIEAHARAERCGIVAEIMSETATVPGYALWLRNLLPAYQEIERALRHHRARPGFAYLAQTSLHRSEPIAADLEALTGTDWRAALPLLPAGERYAARVVWAAEADHHLLLAHAYTRYLGDMNGGRIMRRRLTHRFGPDINATAFHEFPDIPRIGDFAAGFRAALDEAGTHAPDPGLVVEEAVIAFELNIKLSEEVASSRLT
jgi:heme oxygenase